MLDIAFPAGCSNIPRRAQNSCKDIYLCSSQNCPLRRRRQVSHSPELETKIHASHTSWGRILSSTGSVPLSAPLDPSRVSVSFVPANGLNALPVLVHGEPEDVDEDRAKEILSEEDFEVRVELGLGEESARYWTCDFSYVSIQRLFVS